MSRLLLSLLTALSLLGMGGCDRDDDIVACIQKCKAGGGERVTQNQEFSSRRMSTCTCIYTVPFADGGAR